MDVQLINKIKHENKRKSIFKASIIAFVNVFIPWLIACLSCWATTYSPIFYLLFPFLSFYIGTRFRAINNMSHEAIHFSFCRNRKANEIFGEIFAVAEFSKFELIRKEHMTHHKYLGDMKRDMDFSGIRQYGLHKKMTRRRTLRHLRQALLLQQIKDTFFFIIFDRDAPDWANTLRVCYLLILFPVFICFPLWFFCLFIIPFCYFYQVQKHLTDVFDHGGLLKNDDPVHKSRNFIIKNRFLSALLLPRFDGYHLVHHLLPWVSVENHRQAHHILLENSEYRSREHAALKQLREWLNDK
ncbi:fatty acid desaturase [Erwinia pyrifoliae]|uniref:fatty acid desaturase n=1 Tax=Erwinia pyrifoliae TaxID=79967 RepID=UPI00019610A5|nr:fatty acid desaturase [Erwinia pyrifoliae]AUX74259.1 peptide-binding protein [Erwinia pyrifoliae]MCA8875388.1 fatty acid desaturase [Erwinia pyrifoliae]UWS29447.1 fatty acid desaturase [Erwinia pyrifoliae]UXK12437.1 fatty acid desaturase [Erwinia pyrifoliae]CAX53879.1 Fatty acid desaturase family protein [Erwinia pyrifoliae Ep1/96]